MPLDVKAGDRMLFGKWSGTEVKLDGEELLIMKEADIMGIVEKPERSSKPPDRPLEPFRISRPNWTKSCLPRK